MIAYHTSLNNPNISIVDGVILIQKMTNIKKDIWHSNKISSQHVSNDRLTSNCSMLKC